MKMHERDETLAESAETFVARSGFSCGSISTFRQCGSISLNISPNDHRVIRG